MKLSEKKFVKICAPASVPLQSTANKVRVIGGRMPFNIVLNPKMKDPSPTVINKPITHTIYVDTLKQAPGDDDSPKVVRPILKDLSADLNVPMARIQKHGRMVQASSVVTNLVKRLDKQTNSAHGKDKLSASSSSSIDGSSSMVNIKRCQIKVSCNPCA